MAKNLIEIETDRYSCKQKEDVCFLNINQNAVKILARNHDKYQLLAILSKINDSELATPILYRSCCPVELM